MLTEKVYIYEIEGGNIQVLNAEQSTVKLAKTGMFLCKEGEAVLTIDGEEYRLERNDLIVYFSYSALHVVSHSSNLRGTLIGADLETVQPMLYQISNFNALFVIKQQPLQHLTEVQLSSLCQHIQLLTAITGREKQERAAVAQGESHPTKELVAKQLELLSYSLMLDVLQCYANIGAEKMTLSRKDEVLQRFVSTLYRNYRSEHEVGFYAEQQFLTNRYFSTIVKERSGKSPSQWIASALLVDAQDKLKTTSMTVKEISDLLGFPNQSYFGKWFKNLMKMGPLEYRKGRAPRTADDGEFTDVVRKGVAYVHRLQQQDPDD